MKTRVQKPQAVRQKEIVRAALRIMGERGITSLTAATLAEEVGVSSGALFRHFSSVDQILIAVVDHAVTLVETTFPGVDLPPLDRILKLAANRIDLLGTNPGLSWLLRSDQAQLVLPEGGGKRLQTLVKKSRRFLLQALRDGATDGSIRSDVDPEVLIVPVVGTIHILIGTGGAQRRGRPGVDRVLSGLRTLLEAT